MCLSDLQPGPPGLARSWYLCSIPDRALGRFASGCQPGRLGFSSGAAEALAVGGRVSVCVRACLGPRPAFSFGGRIFLTKALALAGADQGPGSGGLRAAVCLCAYVSACLLGPQASVFPWPGLGKSDAAAAWRPGWSIPQAGAPPGNRAISRGLPREGSAASWPECRNSSTVQRLH